GDNSGRLAPLTCFVAVLLPIGPRPLSPGAVRQGRAGVSKGRVPELRSPGRGSRETCGRLSEAKRLRQSLRGNASLCLGRAQWALCGQTQECDAPDGIRPRPPRRSSRQSPVGCV